MALGANSQLASRGAGRLRAFKVAAATHLYMGGGVNIRREAGAGAGYAKVPATNATTVEEFGGIAREEVNNAGSAGATDIEVYTEGEFKLPFGGGGLSQADVGALVYCTSDNVFTLTATNNAKVGRLSGFVSATEAWVDIKSFAA